MPDGTPDYVGAVGSIATCTAQGFIFQMLSITVPTYYGSLSLQAYLGIKNEFQEEKYRWIEIPIHIFAWCVPAAVASIVAVTENFNPKGSGCSLTKAPRGCEADPLIPCERGEDIDMLEYTVGLGVAFLYFIFPPTIVLVMHRWIKRIGRKAEDSRGMQQIRHNARKQMMRQVVKQMSLYLFSFWFTIVPTLIDFVYHTLTGKTIYELLIFANCIFALQGFVMAMVYFALQRSGDDEPKLEGIVAPDMARSSTRTTFRDDHRTSVKDIQTNANKVMTSPKSSEIDDDVGKGRRESFGFNIFDGVPDEDSPWAEFFQDEGSDGEDDALGVGY